MEAAFLNSAIRMETRMRAFYALTLAGVLLGPPAGAMGQVVRGQVVDSVTGTPVVGGVVMLLAQNGDEVSSTLTNEEGRFLLYAPGAAPYRLRAEHEGYHSSEFPEFELQAGRALSYILLLPSVTAAASPPDPFDGLLAGVCGTNTPGVPTIAGWIRDAKTRAPVQEASVSASWANLPDVLAQEVSSIADLTGVVLADSSGFYAICNAPLQRKIVMHAMSADGVSEFHDITFGADAVVAGGEAHFSSSWVWRQDLEIVPLDDLHTVLTGTVTDATTGEPVIGAEVELNGTVFAAQTDSSGMFRIERLPAGAAKLVIRQIGHQPLRQEISLPRSGTLDLPPELLSLGRSAQMLDPLTVETTAAHSPLADFNRRRARGSGAFLTREEWERQGNPIRTIDILRRLRGVRIETGPDIAHQFVVSMRRTTSRTTRFDFGEATGLVAQEDLADIELLSQSECPPLIFLDRHYFGNTNTVNLNTDIPFGDLLAVEAYGSTGSMPMEFNRRGSTCGVIAFWTRHAAPKTVLLTDDTSGLLKSTAFHFAAAIGAVVAIFFGLGQGINF